MNDSRKLSRISILQFINEIQFTKWHRSSAHSKATCRNMHSKWFEGTAASLHRIHASIVFNQFSNVLKIYLCLLVFFFTKPSMQLRDGIFVWVELKGYAIGTSSLTHANIDNVPIITAFVYASQWTKVVVFSIG